MNSCSRPPTAPRKVDPRSVSSPSGGVASRTLPADFERDDAFDEDLLDEDLFDEDVDFFADPDAAEPDFFGDERFLDGPHVVMTLHTVPRGCHPGPRPPFS
jgi:hypothetical protein